MKEAPPIPAQLDDLLLEGLPDLVNPSDLAARLDAPELTRRGAAVAVGHWLCTIDAVRHRPYSGSGDGRALYSLRDHERYASMGPAARLRAFAAASAR